MILLTDRLAYKPVTRQANKDDAKPQKGTLLCFMCTQTNDVALTVRAHVLWVYEGVRTSRL